MVVSVDVVAVAPKLLIRPSAAAATAETINAGVRSAQCRVDPMDVIVVI